MKTLVLSLLIASPAFAGRPDCKNIFERPVQIGEDFLRSIRGGSFPSKEFFFKDDRHQQPRLVTTFDGSITFLVFNGNNTARLVELGALGTKPRITQLNQQFSRNDSHALTKDRKLVRYDSERIQIIDINKRASIRTISTPSIVPTTQLEVLGTDPNYIFWITSENQVKIFDIKTLETRSFRSPHPIYRVVVSQDGHFATFSNQPNHQAINVFRTSDFKSVATYPFHNLFSHVLLLDHGQLLVGAEQTSQRNYDFKVYKPNQSKPITQKLLPRIGEHDVIGGGKYFYLHDRISETFNIFSVASQKFINIKKAISNVYVSEDKNSLILASEKGFLVFDTRTDKQYFISNSASLKSENINLSLGISPQNKLSLLTYHDDPEGQHNGTTNLFEVDLNSKEVQVMEQFNNMHPDFSRGNQAFQVFGDSSTVVSNISQTLAEAVVRKDTRSFLEAMAKKFDSGEYLNEPQETLRNLLTLSEMSPVSVRDIFKKYPGLMNALSRIDLLKPESRAEEGRIREQARKFLETLKPDSLSVEEFIQFIRPLRDIVDQEVLAEGIQKYANLLLRKTELSPKPEIQQIPSYNRFKLIKEHIKGQIGLPWKSSSDLVVTYNHSLKTQIVVFGSHPIDNSPINEFGFYSVIKSEFKANEPRSVNISWRHGDKRLQARVKMRPLKSKDLRPPANDSPDYDSMTADKKLGGAIVISPNIDDSENFGIELAGNYKDFYRGQGYKFESENMPGSQAISLLLQKAGAGEIDYLVREGHSESQTDALVSLWENVTVTIGRKNSKGGIEETIYIIGPKDRHSQPDDNASLAFSVLGRTLRNRPTSSDFIFLQTACMSGNDLGSYVGMVAARGFIPLATDDMADTFTNERSSPIRRILSGILGHKPWSDMRTEVKPNDTTDLWARAENYLFPDQEEYDLGALHRLSKVVEVYIERNYRVLEEQNGK